MMYRLLLTEPALAAPLSVWPAFRRFSACRSAYVRMSRETLLPPSSRAERSI